MSVGTLFASGVLLDGGCLGSGVGCVERRDVEAELVGRKVIRCSGVVEVGDATAAGANCRVQVTSLTGQLRG